MELELSADQQLFLSTSQRWLAEHCPLSSVREQAEGLPADPKNRQRVAELGWFAMFVPAEMGGGSVSGSPIADAAIVAEVRGAGLQAEPFVAVHAAAALIAAAGSSGLRQRLGELAEGTSLIGVPVAGDSLWSSSAGRSALRVRPETTGFRLEGELLTAGGGALDELLVVTRDPELRATRVRLEDRSLSRAPVETLDITQPLEQIRFDGLLVGPEDSFAISAADLDHAGAVAATLSVAESVGAMRQLFELTRQYALDRIAFGRPIGSFQAMKHLLADLSLVVELATAMSAAAVRAVAVAAPHAGEVASMAKAFVGDRAPAFSQGCLQVFGGIGFAWEHDLHLYLRRLTANAALFGTTDEHRDRVLAAHARELDPDA